MNERAVLASSRLRVAAVALLVLAAGVGAAFALGLLGAPGVVDVENRFGPVDETTTVVETDLVVNNPNPVGARLGGTTVEYAVRMNDVRMAAGEKAGVAVGTGNSTLGFTTRMDNERIPDWWVTHVRNDERTVVTVDATVTSSLLGNRSVSLDQQQAVETDLLSAFNTTETRPVNAHIPLISDPVLYVNETRGQWGPVTERRTPVGMAFVVYNPKPVPYAVTEIGYEVSMNGIAVGNGTTERTTVVPAGGTETVRTTPVVRNERLDEWWVSHLRNGQVTQLRIDFYARIELPGGGAVRVPLDALTYERTVETDVFGTKETTSETEGESGSPSDRQTETAASTETRVSTATPTDDGGLL